MADENVKKLGNLSYKERFQFIFSTNDNIICQRYFKIPMFNKESLTSLDLKEVLDKAVDLIQDDLKAKSEVYTYYTTPSTDVQLTGFKEGEEKTFVSQAPVSAEERNADSILEPYEVTFKFEFLVDDRPVYTKIWDGTQYPKYVRNGVDITNSDASYRGRSDDELGYNITLVKRMTNGRKDLVYEIIHSICDVCSHTYAEGNEGYDTYEEYGNLVGYETDENGNFKTDEEGNKIPVYSEVKEYSTTPYKDYVNSWWEYTKKKTRDYMIKNGFYQK